MIALDVLYESIELELELERIQTQTAQKPVLRAVVYARALQLFSIGEL
jgi:hypothetical protein